MIDLVRGNLLSADCEALVNTVNCVGVMGKGVALQFKKTYPNNYEIYRDVCDAGEMVIGKMLVTETGLLGTPKYIINFPTKDHWKNRSKIEDIELGLESLVSEIEARSIKSIALPPLGCGNGGLDWPDVRPLIVEALSLVDVDVQLFEPGYAPFANEQVVSTRKPRLTRFKALLVKLFERYAYPGYEISALEAQKLAWFLDRAGEPTKLNFVKGKYGPYAETLNYSLQEMDGHFISGSGDRSSIRAEIVIESEAVEAADEVLKRESDDASERLDRIFGLIRGFENPYGMELLSAVDWLATSEHDPIRTADDAVREIRKWSARKANLFPEQHIRKTWTHLVAKEWIDPALNEA
ncbi:MAG: macro domain-containing protein [Chloroflexi bacterium]|nr:macro domain-containing protein [Chloroflexota bacterium]